MVWFPWQLCWWMGIKDDKHCESSSYQRGSWGHPPQTPLSTLWKPESEGRGRLQERCRTDCCCCCTDYNCTKHPKSLLAIHLEVEYVRFLLFSDIKITHANTYYLSGCCRDALAYKSCSPDVKRKIDVFNTNCTSHCNHVISQNNHK